MKYKGLIKKSRTLDLAAFSGMLDAVALSFLAFSPEQLGVTVLLYAAARGAVTALQFYVRFKTNGPVGGGT